MAIIFPSACGQPRITSCDGVAGPGGRSVASRRGGQSSGRAAVCGEVILPVACLLAGTCP